MSSRTSLRSITGRVAGSLSVSLWMMLAVMGAPVLAQTARAPALDPPSRYGLGRPATPDEVRALDIDVMPDGRGLPPGQGTPAEGRALYAAKCAACHGPTGEGKSAERLVGRGLGDPFDFATNPKLVRTVGSYWPYATTLFDYTRRAMPFDRPGSLTAQETYAVVAFLLNLNGIIAEDAVMDRAALPSVVMPARRKFVPDNRAGGPTIR